MDPLGPFYKAHRALILSSSVAHFTPLVRCHWGEGPNGVTVQNLWIDSSNDWVDGSNADVVNCTNTWQVVWKPLWCMTCVFLWLVFISDRSVASSFVHFPYKYQGLLFSFLHFQLKHIVRVQPSSLLDAPFILLYQPLTHSLHLLGLSVIDSKNW